MRQGALRSVAAACVAVAALAMTAGCSGASTSGTTPAGSTSQVALPSRSGTAAPVTVKTFDSTDAEAWTASFQVISGPKGVIIIDPGKYDDEVASYVKSLGGVDAILITHGHWDKLRGLDAALSANPKATAYIQELDKPYMQDPVRNCSVEDGFEGRTNAPVTTFSEGPMHVAGYDVTAIHLPGHTEGSSVFYFAAENILMGGDAIMATQVGSSRHPGGNEKDRQASIQKFKRLSFPADMVVFDGHDDTSVTYAKLMQGNADLK